MLNGQLAYGCSRLTGGATAGQAVALVRQCLDGGIRWFDTAPSYGLGTAETVVGRAIAGQPEVRVTVKVGSLRDPLGVAKSWARLAKSLGRPRPALLPEEHRLQMAPATNPGANFSPETMRKSLIASLSRLGRTSADLLLLHEAYADNATPSAIGMLTTLRNDGMARTIGYSHGAIYDPSTSAAFPEPLTAQVGVRPEWLTGAELPPARALVLHSIAKIGQYLKHADPAFTKRLATLSVRLAEPRIEAKALDLALLFALAHARSPGSGLIFASIDRGRLAAFLAALAHVEAHVTGSEIIAALDDKKVAL